MKKKHVFSLLVSRFLFLMTFGLNPDVKDWTTKHLTRDILQKSSFAEVGLFMIPVPFFMILGGIGTNFHDSCCLGDWLEIR